MAASPFSVRDLLLGLDARTARVTPGIPFATPAGVTLALDVYRPEAGEPFPAVVQIPWAEHAFDATPNGTSGQLSLYYIERFLAWALTRVAPDPRR